MKLKKLNLAIITALANANVAIAEESSPVTANIGVVSNYMFRGVTQTDDGPAIQGGVDYAHESGFSLGTWVSNVDFNATEPKYEWDVYAGYGEKLGDFGYNLNLSYFAYPDGKDFDMAEVGASGTWDFLTLGLAYTFYGQTPDTRPPASFRDGDLYYYGNLGFDLPVNFRLSGTLGYYNFNDLGEEGDYTHWQVSLNKSVGDFGTFSLNYDQNDGGVGDLVALDDDPKISIGWKKTF